MSKHIVIVVGGRFHSNRLASALLKAGYKISIFTTLPRSRFPGFLRPYVFSFIFPELVYRLGEKLGKRDIADGYKVLSFGKSVCHAIKRNRIYPDLIIGWSSFALEVFQCFPSVPKILFRDSEHIETQMEKLKGE